MTKDPNELRTRRHQLVDDELWSQGIRNPSVLQAMRTVPRECFIPDEQQEFAYTNAALPIGFGQTISQPLIVAEMMELADLQQTDKVLEIGTGSGYAAAVLSRIAKEIYTIERHQKLAATAGKTLEKLGYTNVHVHVADGSLGWPEKAPFDAILVAAGAPKIPQALLRQLSIGGRLVIPVGQSPGAQRLVRVIRRGVDEFYFEENGAVRFVPLIGQSGWPQDIESVNDDADFPTHGKQGD